MERKAVILEDPTTHLPAKLELAIRESESAPARLKMGLVIETEVEGKKINAQVGPEWRVELN